MNRLSTLINGSKKQYLAPSLYIVTTCHAHMLCQSGGLSANYMSNPGIGDDDDVPTVANVKHANYVDWDNE